MNLGAFEEKTVSEMIHHPISIFRHVAESMTQRYTRDLLSVEELVRRLEQRVTLGDAESENAQELEALARGLCSEALYEACQFSESHLRDLAFERLREYLEQALESMSGMFRPMTSAIREEVLQQTLIEIFLTIQRQRGPEKPRAFLGWVRVILRRQIALYWHRTPINECSLDGEDQATLVELLIDEQSSDPLSTVLRSELREILRASIVGLRNPRYRDVLLLIYFYEREVGEVAVLLGASVAAIYLWHHRALHALHKQLGEEYRNTHPTSVAPADRKGTRPLSKEQLRKPLPHSIQEEKHGW